MTPAPLTPAQLRECVLYPADDSPAYPDTALDELLARARQAALAEAAALLLAMADDADRFAQSAMARLDDLPKAAAFREAAKRVREMT